MAAADVGNAGIEKLNEAAKAHEKDFVIDLAADRIIKWIGVYLFLALAVIIKIADTVDTNFICFPVNTSENFDSQFISYASSYCWETSQQNASSSCKISSSISTTKAPQLLRELIQWFPYALLLQAFLFAIPWSYWHFRFGARLLGHLKFMQLLLDNIFTKLQGLKNYVFYAKKPYDKDSEEFDGLRKYDRAGAGNTSNLSTVQATVTDENRAEENIPLQGTVGLALSENGTVQVKKPTFWKKLLVGEMKDRHLFSMLCYENFASLPHWPYILSVFKLTRSPNQGEPIPGNYYLDHGLLNLWSNKDNLQNTLLVSRYFWKHVLTAIMALIMIILMIIVAVFVYGDVATSEAFPCQLAYEDLCVLCSIRRKRDIFALFMCDLLLTTIIFVGSLVNWWMVRRSVDKVTCHYLDALNNTASYAIRQYNEEQHPVVEESEDEEEQAAADIIKMLKLIWAQWQKVQGRENASD